jgi:hypothetical protein
VEFKFVGNDNCAGVEGVAVVIDVLRAFSFAAYAIDAGAERIILMEDLDATLRLAASIPGALAAKDGVPAEGFDLFNSPGQLLERSDLAGRTIVQRTSAGTVGAVAAREADHLFCASFVVAEATVSRIRRLSPASITFVVTGAGGRGDDDLHVPSTCPLGSTGPSSTQLPTWRESTKLERGFAKACSSGIAAFIATTWNSAWTSIASTSRSKPWSRTVISSCERLDL